MFKIFSTWFFLLFFTIAFSQKPKDIKVDGDYVQGDKYIKNVYEDSKKDTYLNIGKYIDTSKVIVFQFGTVKDFVSYSNLIGGVMPVNIENLDRNRNFIKFKRGKKNMLFSTDIVAFDETTSARIVDNKLINSKGYTQYVTDSSLEIIDDYDVPILQILLRRDSNTIILGGVFHTAQACYIADIDKNLSYSTFRVPKLLMSESERNNTFFTFLQHAKNMTRINK